MRGKNWKPEDENGLGVICHYKMRGYEERSIEVLLKQCWPRFSTQWATDPQQQICYAAIKKVARREFPDVILGVYSKDELEPQDEIEINPQYTKRPEPEKPAEGEKSGEAQKPDQTKPYPQEMFEKNFGKWKTAIEKGNATHKEWIAKLKEKGTLTEAQLKAIEAVKAPIEGEATQEPSA